MKVNMSGPQPNYGPAPPPVDNNLTGSFNQNSKKNKIIVAVGIVLILIFVIVGFSMFTGGEDPNQTNMEEVIFAQQEIARVSDTVLASETLGSEASNIAATASATAKTNVKTASEVLTKSLKGKLPEVFEVESVDSKANDEKIKQGELLNDIDQAYQEVLGELLLTTNAAIARIDTKKPEAIEQLKGIAQSNEVLYESLNLEE